MVALLIIIGIILALIFGIVTIVTLVAILEIFKIVVLGVLIPFTFLWLWSFLKKVFKLDTYIAAGLSILMTSFIAVWVYNSWIYIVILSVVVIILYTIWKAAKDVGILDIIKIASGK